MVLPCTYVVVDGNDYVNMNNNSNNCTGSPWPSNVKTTHQPLIFGVDTGFWLLRTLQNPGLCMVMRCCDGDATWYGMLLCMCQSVLGVR